VRKGKLRERNNLEDIGVDGITILITDLQKVGGRSMDWRDLAQDKDRSQVLVNTDRTFGFLKMWGI
jgi:hypothetical protein